MTKESKLHKLLKQHKYSVTEPRTVIFDALQAAEGPITVTQLIEQLPDTDKVSIYRTVELFEQIGITHRVWTGFKSKIELSQELSHHHHHFTCTRCGKTLSLKSDALEKNLHDFEKQHGFQLMHHSVELSGFCADCQNLG